MPEDIPPETGSESGNDAVEILAPSPTPVTKTDANAKAIEEDKDARSFHNFLERL